MRSNSHKSITLQTNTIFPTVIDKIFAKYNLVVQTTANFHLTDEFVGFRNDTNCAINIRFCVPFSLLCFADN